MIHEIADSAIPIYYWDIGQYAAHTSWLMTEIPEINPNGNAHDQIQANIYEAICEGLHEHIAEKEVSAVGGPLFHRVDIGTDLLVQQRVEQMDLLR